MDSYTIGKMLGWLSVIALAVLLLNFVTVKIIKKPKFLRKITSALHTPAAVTLVVAAVIHSYLIWGNLRIHTGHILFFGILLTAAASILGKKYKFKKWLPLHIYLAFATLALFLVHYFFPYLV
ncbi:MAG TPA: hypothetical protein PLW37_02390 [bacterium]|nr:hypothetical protein [bacterium]HPV21107.1 hypothetical protein [bacterium]HQB08693.1 hypothetical protein [bacterium]